MLYQSVHRPASEGCSSRASPTRSNSGSRRNPSGVNSAIPSIPPPNETFSSTIAANRTRLWAESSGREPDPRAQHDARGHLSRGAVGVQGLEQRLQQLEDREHDLNKRRERERGKGERGGGSRNGMALRGESSPLPACSACDILRALCPVRVPPSRSTSSAAPRWRTPPRCAAPSASSRAGRGPGSSSSPPWPGSPTCCWRPRPAPGPARSPPPTRRPRGCGTASRRGPGAGARRDGAQRTAGVRRCAGGRAGDAGQGALDPPGTDATDQRFPRRPGRAALGPPGDRRPAGRRAYRPGTSMPPRWCSTDAHFGNASPDLDATDARMRKLLKPLLGKGMTPVVPGFIGSAPSGEVTTLGRGGSDLTASLVGRALGAARVNLWKDVPGLLTADPRVVPDARVMPQLNVREAAELAYYGAKVLHPRALIPILGRKVPLFVRPFADPTSDGTEVSERATGLDVPVKALSAAAGQALVTVEGNGMLGVPGVAARTFAALQREGISVSLITQASSEHSICFCVPGSSAEPGAAVPDRGVPRRDRPPGDRRRRASAPGSPRSRWSASAWRGRPAWRGGSSPRWPTAGSTSSRSRRAPVELNISAVVDEATGPEAQRAHSRRVPAGQGRGRLGGATGPAGRVPARLRPDRAQLRRPAEPSCRPTAPRSRIVGVVGPERLGVRSGGALRPPARRSIAREKAKGHSLRHLEGGGAVERRGRGAVGRASMPCRTRCWWT